MTHRNRNRTRFILVPYQNRVVTNTINSCSTRPTVVLVKSERDQQPSLHKIKEGVTVYEKRVVSIFFVGTIKMSSSCLRFLVRSGTRWTLYRVLQGILKVSFKLWFFFIDEFLTIRKKKYYRSRSVVQDEKRRSRRKILRVSV